MVPDQQDNPNQNDEEDVTITDLFPSFDQALATFLHDSFDVPKESHSTLCEALITSQYRTWSDFLFIENIDDLAYQDRGTRIPLAWHVQLKLQRFIDFGQHLTEQGLDCEERKHYTMKAFKDYCQGIVKARRDSAADGGVVTNRATAPPDGPGRSRKPIAQLKYESWIRKPRDETTFPVLQNDAKFEHWLVKFKAQLDANGDFSSSCVLYHHGTRDGCQAYFDFVEFHNPVSPPTPPAALVSSPGPVPVRPPAVGNIVTPRPTPPVSTHAPVHSTSSTPAVHNSPPTSACKTDVHSTVDNPETPTGLPCSSNPGSTADSTSTGTSSYTWKYSPSTDSVRFRRTAYSSTPSIVPADIPTGDVPSKRNCEPHSTRNRESHSPRARTSYPPPANSRWTFYPQSETVVFHRPHKPVSFPQSTCISSLQLPPSGALSKDSVVPSSVHAYSQYGASSYPVQKPIYGAHGAPTCPFRKPLYSAYSMTYDSPAVCITKQHRDAIKLKLYHLHATLLLANWMYDDVT
eukprot:jgi/Psemu1/15318/gm1.15318_g